MKRITSKCLIFALLAIVYAHAAQLSAQGVLQLVEPRTLPEAMEGVAYHVPIVIQGGTPPYTVTTNGTTYPPGITLQNDGMGNWWIGGTPPRGSMTTLPGQAVGLFVTESGPIGQQVIGSYNLHIFEDMALNTTFDRAIAGEPYNADVDQNMFISGGGTRPYNIDSVVGLPAGLVADLPNKAITGIAGPSSAGVYTLGITYSDSSNTPFTFTEQVQFEVIDPLTFPGVTLPQATEQTNYTAFSLAASGGVAPYTYEYLGGLPTGMTIDRSGVVSGTPFCGAAESSPYSAIEVRIIDSNTPPLEFIVNTGLSLDVSGPLLALTTTTLPNAEVGNHYDAPISYSGANSNSRVEIKTVGLPSGLTFAFYQGAWRIMGAARPKTEGRASVTFIVTETDRIGSHSLNMPLALNIGTPPPTSDPDLLNSYLPSGIENETYRATILNPVGGSGSYLISAQGLPNGVVLGLSASGQRLIAGIPEVGSHGFYSVNIRVEDTVTGRVTTRTYPMMIIATPITDGGSSSSSNPAALLDASLVDSAAEASCSLSAYGGAQLWWLLIALIVGVVGRQARRRGGHVFCHKR